MALTDKLTAIGDAIRSKTGKTGALTLEQMASEVSNISTGLGDDELALATATAGDVLSGKTFYSGDKTLKTGTRLKPEDQGWNVATGGTSCSITVTNGAYYDIVASYYQDTYTISRTFNITGCTTISSKGDTEISSNNYLKNYARSYVVKATSTKITFSFNTYAAGNGRLVVHYKRIA